MTTVTFNIGGNDHSHHVIQADLWRESLTGIGTWEVILDPHPHNWTGVFAVDQPVSISINGVLMMAGYLDAAKPFLADTGTFTLLYRLSGRDYGLDLATLYIIADYRNMRADDIVQAALIASGGELRFASPSAAIFQNYEFNRKFLADGIQELAQNAGYDFYVDNVKAAGIVPLHFFPVGIPWEHTAVNLTSDVGGFGNNILDFDMGETDGFNLANRVEAIAGPLNDHYTDMNVVDWVGINATVTNLVPPPTLSVLHGKSSMLVTNNTGVLNQIGVELTFPRYNHTVLDLSASTTGKYDYLVHDTLGVTKRVRIRLRDLNNNEIEFLRLPNWLGFTKCYQCTDQLHNDEWRTVDFPLGAEAGIEPAVVGGATVKGYWYEFAGAFVVPFDWENVDRIRFYTTTNNTNPNDYFVIDGLSLPNVEVISIATDPTPIGGTRMLPVYRSDIKSQVELDAFAAWKLVRTQDPLENIQIVAIGQTGTPYAAQSLDIRIAPCIPALTQYRIFSLHHQVVKSSDESLQPGYTFITEYNLIRNELTTGGSQLITPETALFPVSPVKADIRKKRSQLYALDRMNLP